MLVSLLATAIYAYGQPDRAAPADVIIILGGGTFPDGTPSDAQVRRIAHGVRLYKRGIAPWLLCTGGYDHPTYAKSEAQTCVDGALAGGVPESAILREDVSLTTIQNAIQAQRIMTIHNLMSAVIVSDNFHLFRAEWLFHHFGMSDLYLSPAQATQGSLPLDEALFDSYREVGAFGYTLLRLTLFPN